MKKSLGLDIGSNSIGWALVSQDSEVGEGGIIGLGSRIIPMSQEILGDFEDGNSWSPSAERTGYRGIRRLLERYLLRRERLHRVLNVMNFLPVHYAGQIDFEKRLGQFVEGLEPKLAYDNKTFIFKKSFEEMLDDFRRHQPQLLENGKKVPYDWTIYYLRRKALSQKIEKEELAWIILNFNQKRGYYQSRNELEIETPNKLTEFHSLRIIDVVADEKPNSKGETWYSLHLENGWIYRRSSKIPLFDWKDKVRDFIVTTGLMDDGSIKTDKEGKEDRSFKAPGEDDWTLLKKKTEKDIETSGKTVGAFIYEHLLQNPDCRIKGRLVRTIERSFYREELEAILNTQIKLQPELFADDIYSDCVRELYRNNGAHQLSLSRRNFTHLFVNDIIFYQRPLRSQKSSIANCPLEYRKYTDRDGNGIREYLKVISKSNPVYQEFRIWQWLFNLKIYDRDGDRDVTSQHIRNIMEREKLFDFLNSRSDISQKALLKRLGLTEKTHRWNFVEDRTYPCNETGTQIRNRLAKVENVPANFLTAATEHQLWHLIYSVTDRTEYEKALRTFAVSYSLDESSFVENFRKFPPFSNEYGAFSEKAIKKLLPLMRLGKYWSWEAVGAKERISKIITGEYDSEIKDRVREKAINLKEESHFQALPLWLAQYIVYDRHSEADIAGKWNSVADLERYLKDFKQYSLRNPIVEQVITETLRVVRDIWKEYGKGAKDFFKEIHIELGRDLKNTAEERRQITSKVAENENTNIRIKALLMELKDTFRVENVRPYSPSQQDILKIYEEGVINSNIDIPEDILKISKTAYPTSSELQRYKLWLEQKYCSPYTGQPIPLGKLFTAEYEIEHIIPQSRYFDDSFSNKVICESEVNKLKDRQLGMEFIRKHHGQMVSLGLGRERRIFSEEEYISFVKEHYTKNRSKRNKLLLDEIPEKMIERQMNDTRYISKFISSVLSNIVREATADDGVNSKNILACNGKMTTALKQDWGLNDVWNNLILPRFERMNSLTGTEDFTSLNQQGHKIPVIPIGLSKGFQKKRIDHRHHAMDALVIACTTREHINYFNNRHANDENMQYGLRNKLCTKTKTDDKGNYRWLFNKPWSRFTQDAMQELEMIIVSFKQNLRVINKTNNKYQVYENGKKILKSQEKGDSWAIRKPLHKETVFARVSLRKVKTVRLREALKEWQNIVDGKLKNGIREIAALYGKFDVEKINKYFKDRNYLYRETDISKVNVYYFDANNAATRKPLDTSFNAKKIESVTDTGIRKILLNHLAANDNNPEVAFSAGGIDRMNQTIKELNNGKQHQPVYTVRVYETIGQKFSIGYKGNKKSKFVEAAKGTNLFFAIYVDENGKRSYETVPLNIVIERLKQGLSPVPETNEKEHKLLFHLSPYDLVYIPTEDERHSTHIIDWLNLNKEQNKNIYKIVSFTDSGLYATPQNVAVPIVRKVEYSSLNKIYLTHEKECCIKLKVDRLGNIKPL